MVKIPVMTGLRFSKSSPGDIESAILAGAAAGLNKALL